MNIESSGSFGSSSDAFAIKNSGATLNVTAMDGVYINVDDTDGDTAENVFIEQLYSKTGDIELMATGSLYDANRTQEVDQADLERLQVLWSQLGILMDGDGSAQEAVLLTKECNQFETAYHDYWMTLDKITAAEEFSDEWSEERNGYVDTDGDGLADTYQTVTFSKEDYIEELNATLEDLVKRITDVDPTLIAEGAEHDINFAVTDAHKTALATRFKGSLWTQEELLARNGADVFGGTTTTMRTEEANIVGKNVVLEISGNIGAKSSDEDAAVPTDYFKDAFSLFTSSDAEAAEAFKKHGYAYMDFTADQLTPVNLMTLSTAEQLWIASSEASDRVVTTNEDGETVTRIYGAEDINISASGTVAAKAGGYALIGSGLQAIGGSTDQDMTVSAAVAGEELRVKVDGNLLQDATGHTFVDELEASQGFYTGAGENVDLVLESSKGNLGTSAQALLVQTSAGITARAFEDIYLQGMDETMVIDRVSKEDTSDLYLTTEKDLLYQCSNIVLDKTTHIEAENLTVQLTKGSDIVIENEYGTTTTKSIQSVIIDDDTDMTITDQLLITGTDSATNSEDWIIIENSQVCKNISVDGELSGVVRNADESATGIGKVLTYAGVENISTGDKDDTVTLNGGTLDTLNFGDGSNTLFIVGNDDGKLGSVDKILSSGVLNFDASEAKVDLSWDFIDGQGSLGVIEENEDITNVLGDITIVDNQSYSIESGYGDDIINVTNTNLASINARGCKDSITITNSEVDTINSAKLDESDKAESDDDTLVLDGANVALNNTSVTDGLNIGAGAENVVLTGSTVTNDVTIDEGATSVTATGSSVNGGMNIGAGATTVTLTDSTVAENVSIGEADADADTSVTLKNTSVTGALKTGHNFDAVKVEGTSETPARIGSIAVGENASTVDVANVATGAVSVGDNAESVELNTVDAGAVSVGDGTNTIDVVGTTAESMTIGQDLNAIELSETTVTNNVTIGDSTKKTITIKNANIGGALNTGEGSTQLTSTTTDDGTGNVTNTIGSITLGDGNDVVLENTKVEGDVTTTGIADNRLQFTDSTVMGNVATGGGADTIVAKDSVLGNVSTGDGADTITATDSIFANISMGTALDTASDNLILAGVKAGTVDMGAGDDSATINSSENNSINISALNFGAGTDRLTNNNAGNNRWTMTSDYAGQQQVLHLTPAPSILLIRRPILT